MILEKQHPTLFPSVEKMAQQIQSLTRQQKARLLQLVPDLQTIQPEEAEIPDEQLELIAYFDCEMETLPGRHMQDDDIFIAGLTITEFSVLPEREKARLWKEEHLDVEQELGYHEQEIRSDAVPAR